MYVFCCNNLGSYTENVPPPPPGRPTLMNIAYCSYQVDFSEGPPIQCAKYHVNSAICENLGLNNVLVPSIWSSPDQHYADNLLDVIGDLVRCLTIRT